MSWMWLVTAASLAGVVMNIYKYPMCFAVWCGTNLAWMVYDIRIGAYPQAAMFFVYLVTSVWGLWKWTREAGAKKKEGRGTQADIRSLKPGDVHYEKECLRAALHRRWKARGAESMNILRNAVTAMPDDSER